MFKTATEAADWIQGARYKGQKNGLENMRALLAALGNPQNQFRSVHIAGTNGKGSTAAYTESILRQAGYRTGMYTSPYLITYNERVQVMGKPIPDEDMISLNSRIRQVTERLLEKNVFPTTFELGTALAFAYLAQQKVDFAVIEVGIGGRLDSTNVIPAPEAAVITNIGLEHTAILGSTLAAIAAEKSGILKPGCRAVLYGQSREVGEVVARVCAEKEIPLTVTDASQLTLLSSGLDGQHFTYRGSAPLLLPLLGDYQLRNAMTVLDTVDALGAQGWNISADAVARGLAAARWPGRLELVRRRPDLIIDGGHNPQCAQALAASLRGLYGEKKLIFLIGVLADKDWQSMVGEVLPLAKAIVTVRPESDRAKDENELAAWVRAQGVPAEAHASIGEALDAALALAGPEDAVCAWGSLYSVGELRHCLGLC